MNRDKSTTEEQLALIQFTFQLSPSKMAYLRMVPLVLVRWWYIPAHARRRDQDDQSLLRRVTTWMDTHELGTGSMELRRGRGVRNPF